MTGFDRFAVDRDVAAADRALNRRPARLAEARGEEEVQALILGFDGNCERERERGGDGGTGRRGDGEMGRNEIAARNLIVLPFDGNWLCIAPRLLVALFPCRLVALSPRRPSLSFSFLSVNVEFLRVALDRRAGFARQREYVVAAIFGRQVALF